MFADVINPERIKLSRKIDRAPDQHLSKQRVVNGPDRALDEWV